MKHPSGTIVNPPTRKRVDEWEEVVLADNELTASTKVVAWGLTKFISYKTGKCNPKHGTLGAKAGIRRDRTVEDGLAALRLRGHVGALPNNGGRNAVNWYVLRDHGEPIHHEGQLEPMPGKGKRGAFRPGIDPDKEGRFARKRGAVSADKEGRFPPTNGGAFRPSQRTTDKGTTDKRNHSEALASGASAPGVSLYAWEGRVIHLNKPDFESWRKSFTYLDLPAELIARDAWLSEQDAAARKVWYLTTSKYLANRNAEALAKGEDQSGLSRFDRFGNLIETH